MYKKKKEPTKQSRGEQDGRIERLLVQLGEAVSGVAKGQQELNERVGELEKGQDSAGKAELFVKKLAYDPDRKHLPGMTILPLSAVEPFAVAMTCGSVLSDEVLKGEVSLTDIQMQATMLLLRSVKGEGFKAATEHAKEEAEATKPEGAGAGAVDLGRGF